MTLQRNYHHNVWRGLNLLLKWDPNYTKVTVSGWLNNPKLLLPAFIHVNCLSKVYKCRLIKPISCMLTVCPIDHNKKSWHWSYITCKITMQNLCVSFCSYEEYQ